MTEDIDTEALARQCTDGMHFDEQRRHWFRDDDGTRLLGVGRAVSACLPPRVVAGKHALFDRIGNGPRERGTAVHLALEYDAFDDLDDTTLDEHTAGCVAAGRRWKLDRGAETRLVEQAVWSVHGYMGFLDAIGTVDDRALGRAWAIWDWKGGAVDQAEVGLQTMAYASGFQERTGIFVPLRFAVCLRPDGTYTQHEYRDDYHQALPVFLAGLSLEKWRRAMYPAEYASKA